MTTDTVAAPLSSVVKCLPVTAGMARDPATERPPEGSAWVFVPAAVPSTQTCPCRSWQWTASPAVASTPAPQPQGGGAGVEAAAGDAVHCRDLEQRTGTRRRHRRRHRRPGRPSGGAVGGWVPCHAGSAAGPPGSDDRGAATVRSSWRSTWSTAPTSCSATTSRRQQPRPPPGRHRGRVGDVAAARRRRRHPRRRGHRPRHRVVPQRPVARLQDLGRHAAASCWRSSPSSRTRWRRPGSSCGRMVESRPTTGWPRRRSWPPPTTASSRS